MAFLHMGNSGFQPYSGSGNQLKHLTLAARKRLEIARSLATEPRLLLLDEVLAGLTPTETHAATELVRQFQASEKLTIL